MMVSKESYGGARVSIAVRQLPLAGTQESILNLKRRSSPIAPWPPVLSVQLSHYAAYPL